MAFIPPEDEDSQEGGMNVLAEGQQPPPEQPQVAGAAPAGAGTPVAGGQPAAPQPKQPSGSGMFTDIRKYIKANQPATQRLAGAVTGKVSQQAGDIRKQIEKQRSQFQQGLQTGQQQLTSAQQFAQQAIQQAGQQPISEQDVQRFQDIIGGKTQFTTPQSLDLGEQRARSSALAGLAGRAGRADTRQQLLRQTFGDDRRYTRGQQSLDALLLGTSPTAARDIAQTTREQFTGLPTEIAQARKEALQGLQGLQTGAREFLGPQGSAAQQLLGPQGELQTVEEAIRTGAEAARAAREEQVRGLEEAFRTGQFTQEQADLLGLTAGQELFGVGEKGRGAALTQFLSGVPTAEQHLGAFASPEEAARYTALSRLAGTEEEARAFSPEELQAAEALGARGLQEEFARREADVGEVQRRIAREYAARGMSGIESELRAASAIKQQALADPTVRSLYERSKGSGGGSQMEQARQQAKQDLVKELAFRGVSLDPGMHTALMQRGGHGDDALGMLGQRASVLGKQKSDFERWKAAQDIYRGKKVEIV